MLEHADAGVTILRGAVPPELVVRLRASAEAIRAITRRDCGPTATRPAGGFVGGRVIDDFLGLVDTSPFEALGDVPTIRRFVDAALGPDFTNDPQAFTLLLQAEDREIVQGWHRDYRDNVPWLDLDRWLAVRDDVRYFNQFNCALYHDMSLWIVPGSHRRDDTPDEAAVVTRERGAPPDWIGDDPAARVAYSQAAQAYLRSMPGAYQAVLAPGDIAIYRDSALHLGHYVPTVTRATLHGHFDNDLTRPFFEDHFRDRLRAYPT